MGDKDCQKWRPIFQGLMEPKQTLPHSRNIFCIVDRVDRSLYTLLLTATEVIGDVADNMYSDQYRWQRDIFGHSFNTFSRSTCPEQGPCTVVGVFKNWLRTHEEAQVMVASILVVVGLWWLVRAVLTLLINLVCPLVVVILAVVGISVQSVLHTDIRKNVCLLTDFKKGGSGFDPYACWYVRDFLKNYWTDFHDCFNDVNDIPLEKC